jgi:hypothetical protein
MSPEQEEQRGERARQVLDNEVYREAYKAMTDRIVSQLSLADTPDDKRERLNDLLIALAKVENYLRQVLVSGTMAAMDIERRRTLAERLTGRRA